MLGFSVRALSIPSRVLLGFKGGLQGSEVQLGAFLQGFSVWVWGFLGI